MTKKSLKGLILGFIIVFLSGCANEKNATPEDKEENEYSKIDNLDKKIGKMNIFKYCDKETGVEYLIYTSIKKGGITPRLADSTGKIKSCK